MDKKIIEEIIKKIEEYDTIVIHRHIRPDGDCIGCSLGLKEVLKNSFPTKHIYSVGKDAPDFLSFLGEEDEIDDNIYVNALAIVVDSSVADRVYDQRFRNAKEIIKIDHHIPQDNFGTINYVIEEYGACSYILTEMFLNYPDIFKMNDKAATCLLTAVMTDTGRFKYGLDSTSLKLSSYLLQYHIDTDLMFAYLYTKEKESYQFTGWVYNNFKVTENGVAYIYINKDVKRQYKIGNDDASATINTLDSIKGSLIWILFNEQDEEIRVRLRSRFIPIDKLANNYHGGGHENACGATVYTMEEANQLILDADQILKEFKLKNEDKF